jgi:RNA polymerase sigma-70 factor, ECF subfamily
MMIDVMENIDCKKLSGKDIVERVIANPDFYACVVSTYENQLRYYIARLTNIHNEEVDDVLQEIFIKAYQNINSYDADFKFSTWLYRIAHNETISYWRKHKKQLNDVQLDTSEDFVANIKDDTDLPSDMDREFIKENIQVALCKLPFKYREVIVLRYLEDRDYQDISDILKKPVSTVGTLLKRAKSKLKIILE